ncbi:hypothetical protein GBAR_LOCUS18095 [Geodia barretti]|uniref:Uncharacterized protein n=1 Tax=Geodia barretti TaxID=519541 RepID=A0AA35SMQ7_GEOBA|nr:hypothetical protein GBAR_LOCUS18095 [Geodia barretti]
MLLGLRCCHFHNVNQCTTSSFMRDNDTLTTTFAALIFISQW